MKKTLTFRYTLHQMAYWATAAGIVSFATAFLLGKGFAPSLVGTLLASGNLLSCIFQPILADRADRIGGNVIKWLTVGLTALCGACFLVIGIVPLGNGVMGFLYLTGVFFFDSMNPLMNAISVSYMHQGYRVNYGLGRGLGSLAYAFSALAIGEVMARMGGEWMIWISLGLLTANLAIAATYPDVRLSAIGKQEQQESCSALQFFGRYKWYCASLLGVMLLGMFHAMTENYLIEIVAPLGGDSGSVGVALFIATAIETVVIVRLDWIRSKLPDTWLLKIAGISFVLKSVLFLLAGNVMTIYAIQLLQATSYSLLSPTQMYYANARIRMADMVKGQAFITASYTLGCAAGNFTGGQLLSFFGIRTLLLAGVAIAAAGTAVFFLTVDKKDIA